MRLIAGADFTKEDIKNAGDDNLIHVFANADGNLIGGMTYNIDAEMKHPSNQGEKNKDKKDDCEADSIQSWIEKAEKSTKHIKSVKVKRITLDINFDTGCD